ncbi:MAG: hypothetical protein INR65_04075, partial [Gluconacetobacter diazotrophicus]|nr:hypothetical protein [Gluconacetobacter diazotrophicus]
MGTDGVASRSGFPAPRRDRRCAFRRDERGAVAVVTGLVLTALVGMAAMVVDVGLAWYRHSQLQAAADMAALSATFSLSPAATAAANQAATDASVVNALAGNGFAGTTHATAVGSYDPTAVLGSRLAIGSGTMNAVQVSAQSTSPVLFGRIFGGGSTIPLGVTSAATRVDLAGLTAGTTLATLDTTQSALLNALLGQALGSSVALSAASYKGLMGATVSMANLLPALATQANLTAGTYGQLAGASLTVGQLARAALSAAQADGTLTTSL